MLISGSDFAKFIGCARQNIYKHVREGSLIKHESGKYDLNNKINLDYILRHGKTQNDIENYVLTKSEKKVKNKEKSNHSLNKKHKKKTIPFKKVNQVESKKNEKILDFNEKEFENITGLPARMMKLNLKQLVLRYGGQHQLKGWADILNKIMMASERDQKIQIRKLELIDKDFVVSRLFSYLETLNKQIFNIPLSLTDHIIALVKSEKDNYRNDIIELLKKELEKLIKDTKDRINQEIEGLKSKYEVKSDIEEDM